MENGNQDGAKALNLQGEPAAGPDEKAGKDAVQAKLSYRDLGVKRAKEIVRVDERLAAGKTTVRQDLLEIIKSPQDSWGSYTEGFKAVLDERKKSGEPTVALGVLRSQVSRVLNAAKTQNAMVAGKLADTKLRWEQLLKSLPKTSNRGRPSETTVSATNGGEGVNVDTETNVGTLVQTVYGALKRLVKIGKEKDAPFALYFGANMLEIGETVQRDFQTMLAEHSTNGHIEDKAKFMKALGLAEEVAAAPAATVSEPVVEQAAEEVQRTGTDG